MTKLALLLGGLPLLAGACRAQAPAPAPASSAGVASDEDRSADDPAAWTGERGGVRGDPVTGLELTLPPDWESRPLGGDTIWEARWTEWDGVTLRLERWSGSVEELVDRYAPVPQSWLSGGPFTGLEELADGPPLVGSLPTRDGMLLVSWYLRIEGRGLAIEAALPDRGFESAWREVDGIVRSARRTEQ